MSGVGRGVSEAIDYVVDFSGEFLAIAGWRGDICWECGCGVN